MAKAKKVNKRGGPAPLGVLWAVFFTLTFLFLLFMLLLVLEGRHREYRLRGDETVYLEVGEDYEDPGLEILSVGRLSGSRSVVEMVYALEPPDTDRPGEQTMEYLVSDRGREKRYTRTVIVEDTQKPVIELAPILSGYEPCWMIGFVEPGYSAWDEVDGDLGAAVQVTRLEDRVVYSVRDSSGNEAVAERELPAMEPPQIELIGGAELSVPTTLNWEDPGWRVVDDQRHDLSSFVTTESGVTPGQEGSYEVRYTLTNIYGDSVSAVRHVTFRPMEIELIGGSELTVPASLNWEDPGWRLVDGEGNDLSDSVWVEGNVIPYRGGEYEVYYIASDSFGEPIRAVRHVTVVPAERVETVIPEQKTIYLTFDDGPGPYTSQLLDVLDRYGVKATFFVTCAQPDYADCIGRAYRAGHAIGVHTATHNYYTIYSSEQAYMEDFMTCEELIYQQTGSYTRLFRFPGGSSNTVSNYNPGIMSRLTRMMTDLGYYYFDWNVLSGDAGETTDTYQVYYNVAVGCGDGANVVLQHDIKGFSVEAVESIILWGLNNGYQFLPLDESSFGAHHGVNN